MYRDQYFKGQKVEYSGNNRTFFGEIIDIDKPLCTPWEIKMTVLWDTGIQRDYYGDNSMIALGKIKPVVILDKPKPPHKFSKNNPNRRFVEDGKKI